MTRARATTRDLVRIAVLLVAGTGSAVAQAPVDAVFEAGTFEVRGTALPVDLGQIRVPANRDSGDAMLTLRFVRFRSTARDPGSPIVFLAGGPGDAATRAFRGIPLELLDRMRAIADVIAFDQRGTGTSEPEGVLCAPRPMLPTDRPLDPAEMLPLLRDQLVDCLAVAADSGVDVMGLTTNESADDLEALRVALAAPKLTLLAGSYGTHLALAAARRHPRSIDRLALLGVEGPDHTLKLPSRVDTVVARIAAAFRPTLADDIRALRRRLREQPVEFAVGSGRALVLGEWDVQRWVAESLDTRREIGAMIEAMPELIDGEYGALARWAVRYRMARPMNLMGVAMDCASYASLERRQRIAREAQDALLGAVIDFPLPGLCDTEGLPRLPDSARAPLVSDVPALLVSGTLDGRTPVANAHDMATGMPNARMLTVDGASHDLFQDERVMDELMRFLQGTG